LFLWRGIKHTKVKFTPRPQRSVRRAAVWKVVVVVVEVDGSLREELRKSDPLHWWWWDLSLAHPPCRGWGAMQECGGYSRVERDRTVLFNVCLKQDGQIKYRTALLYKD
jgi:hypothetical protein